MSTENKTLLVSKSTQYLQYSQEYKMCIEFVVMEDYSLQVICKEADEKLPKKVYWESYGGDKGGLHPWDRLLPYYHYSAYDLERLQKHINDDDVHDDMRWRYLFDGRREAQLIKKKRNKKRRHRSKGDRMFRLLM
jgi:hypothetical protein